MTKTITHLYDSDAEAHNVVSDLEAAGIPSSDISIVGRRYDEADNDAATGAGTGAVIGSLVGGGAGLLAGLGMLAIPGVGPVVAAGWLVATAAGAGVGAGVGAATGGVVGALTDAGVDRDHAQVYAEGVRRGGTLVTVKTDDSRAATAEAIMQKRTYVDPVLRGKAYRDTGWTGFDEKAVPYTRAEAERERALYR